MSGIVKRISKAASVPVLGLAAAGLLLSATAARAADIAVWADGSTSTDNPILGTITSVGDTYQLVTTAQLATPGFLSSGGFSALVETRADADFGTFLDAAAAANVTAWVGVAGSPGQGGVAVFTNDIADNLYGSGPPGYGSEGDPFDPNLNALFTNALNFAADSGHGFIGEFNGAVQAVASNSAGATPLDLLQGNAAACAGGSNDGNGTCDISPQQFVFDVGPIGSGNAIDKGVTFPFTDDDVTTFYTDITGANSGNIVDIYTNSLANGAPAILANDYVISGGMPTVPEPSTWAMMALGFGLLGLVGYRKTRSESALA